MGKLKETLQHLHPFRLNFMTFEISLETKLFTVVLYTIKARICNHTSRRQPQEPFVENTEMRFINTWPVSLSPTITRSIQDI
jgi:hypothetical protein